MSQATAVLPLSGCCMLGLAAGTVMAQAHPIGSERVQSNDVTVDDRGLLYLLDRVRGLYILERT
ncbi:MAG: hypothetical protein ACK59Y_14410 [Betaproteobacteria bacterium]|jgi:hypothetical protein|nr:hypothetical protein [Betaproteobacteria bacterium]